MDDIDEDVLDVGTKVEVRYKGGQQYYSGRIVRVGSNSTFDIEYDDGDREQGVKRGMIKVKSGSGGGGRSPGRSPARTLRIEEPDDKFEVGALVEADYKGKGKYYAGKIAKVRLNGSYDIDYDDGEKEMMVPKDLVRLKAGKRATSPTLRSFSRDDPPASFDVGTAVEADYKGKGKYYAGKIARIRLNDKYDIDYDDGEKELMVPKNLIRLKGRSGSPVKPLKLDSLDDRDKLNDRDRYQDSRDRDRDRDRLEEGAAVEANYRGRGKYYTGKIARVRINGTFDIDYDDGEKEQAVERDNIRAIARSTSSTSASAGGGGAALEVGMAVEADYRGQGKYYTGKIARVRLNGTYDIDYDDGENEQSVRREAIRVKRSLREEAAALEVGVAVEADYKGKGKYYAGKIARVRLNGTYDIDYDDGEKELSVPKDMIRVKPVPSRSRSPPAGGNSNALEVGVAVEADYKGKGKYYAGKISRVRLNGTFDIDYDDGEKELGVPKDLIRVKVAPGRSRSPPPSGSNDALEVGTVVEADYKGKGNYYAGKIARVRLNGTYDIDYDDGEKELSVLKDMIRVKGRARSPALDANQTLEVGVAVEANYKGKGKYYAGKITRVRLNGTYDIDYDDGEKELGVERDNIRVKARARDDDRSIGGSSMALEVGVVVEADYKGKGKYYAGKIARVRLNGTYDIDYDDGEKEMAVPKEMIRIRPSARSPSRDDRERGRVADLEVGVPVEANYKGKGKYYAGKISRVRLNGTYDIDYDDGEKEMMVAKEFIRVKETARARTASPPPNALEVGVAVEADYKGKGKYYAGKIARVRLNGTCDIDYDDGEKELGVPKDLIRVKPTARSPSREDRYQDRGREPALDVGVAVEAKYKGGGKYYPGKIARVRLNGTCDIDYDGGEKEMGVLKENIRVKDMGRDRDYGTSSSAAPQLEVGVAVEANYKGNGKYYAGKIARVRLNGTYDVDYDDGEKELSVPKEFIRVKATARSPSRDREREREPDLEVGAAVEADYKGKGKYYPGKIARVRLNGTYDIDYDDGEKELSVSKDMIRAKASSSSSSSAGVLEEGLTVEADYRGRGKYFRGKITRVRLNGSCDIAYDDGESEQNVPRELIRILKPNRDREAASVLDVGMRVEADYKGKGKYYAGKIARVRLNGTCDIDYDDGEKEMSVPKESIRVMGSAGRDDRDRDSNVLEVGLAVEANYKGRGKYFRGKITRVRLTGDCDIDYDDGETETNVPKEYIRVIQSRSTSNNSRMIEVGAKLEANYRGRGKYYPGRVARVRSDGTYDIDYDDGEQEQSVPLDCLKLPAARDDDRGGNTEALEAGMSVEADYKGRGKYYAGKIARVRLTGDCDIDYDDGEKEASVPKERIRVVRRGASQERSRVTSDADFEVGTAVEADYKGKGKYYPGKIARVRLNGTYDIDYDDGEKEVSVPKDAVRLVRSSKSRNDEAELDVGMDVEADYKGKGKYYPGKIARVRLTGTYDIDYEDGEKETSVPRNAIRVVKKQPGRDDPDDVDELQVGTVVEADYQGRGRFYPGIITRVRVNGTYDIDYEDKEKEIGVRRDRIIVSKKKKPTGSRSASRDREDELEVGMEVEANYKGKGKYFPGKITRVRLNGTCDIDYDDGESEQGVPNDLIRELKSHKSPIKRRDDDDDDEFVVGAEVEADYKGNGKYYPGRIARVRPNGTYDIDYDDGEQEQSVPKKYVKLLRPSSHKNNNKNSNKNKKKELTVGTVVEANYNNKGRWYPGKISRVRHQSDSYDIDYDDGETETNVPRSRIRIEGGSDDDDDDIEEFERGDTVFARKYHSNNWEKAVVTAARSDGTYDVQFAASRETETRLPADHLSSSRNKQKKHLSTLRSGFLDRVTGADNDSTTSIRPGSRAACYWYKSSKFGRAREQQEPKSCVVLAHNPDATYTVELEDEMATRLDDVPEDLLKLWGTATADLSRSQSLLLQNTASKPVDVWEAVIAMAHDLQQEHGGKISPKHDIPTLSDLSRKAYDAEDNIKRIVGGRYFDELKEEFGRQDRYEEDEISPAHAVKGFKQLGRAIDEVDLNRWLLISRSHNNNSNLRKSKDGNPRNLNFVEFVQAFANLSYGSAQRRAEDGGDELTQRARAALRRSLRLNQEATELTAFATSFGSKLMRELERAFDKFATRPAPSSSATDAGAAKLSVGNLVNAFHALGKGVTTTKITEWMTEIDVSFTDTLTLADFACVYAFFFGPHRKQSGAAAGAGAGAGSGSVGRSHLSSHMTLSELAVQTLQEERWTGQPEQVNAFILRLHAGRPESVKKVISALRDAFEALDVDNIGSILLMQVGELFKSLSNVMQVASLGQPIRGFIDRIEQYKRKTVSLPELVEAFGMYIEEAGKHSVSIREAFSLLTLRNSLPDVRVCVEKALEIIERILQHPKEHKYWRININAEEFAAKIWKKDGGKELMRAIGFGSPMTDKQDESNKVAICLAGLEGALQHSSTATRESGNKQKGEKSPGAPKQQQQVSTPKGVPAELPREYKQQLLTRRSEIDAELCALDGAPSVSSAVRTLREHATASETVCALTCALTIVKNLLNYPKDLKHYRVKTGNNVFHRELGRLQGSQLLMQAIGFGYDGAATGSAEPAAYVFKSLSSHGSGAEQRLSTTDLSNFKFPAMTVETESFLLRRKRDLEFSLHTLDPIAAQEFSERPLTASIAVQDAAHVAGTTPSSLVQLSKTLKQQQEQGKRPHSTTGAGKAGVVGGTGKVGSTGSKEANKLAHNQQQIAALLANATELQSLQIEQLKHVFSAMDADGDGMLTFDDVRAYFRAASAISTAASPAIAVHRSIGLTERDADVYTRKWITARDLDQDGAISIVEFIAAWTHVLAPSEIDARSESNSKQSKTATAKGSTLKQQSQQQHEPASISPIAAAFGMLRLANTPPQVHSVLQLAHTYVQRICDSPTVSAYTRINVGDATYRSTIGNVTGGLQLMFALGFVLSTDESMLLLRDPNTNHAAWDTVPLDVRTRLKQRMEELWKHGECLYEPTVSNCAAVSGAISLLGGDKGSGRNDQQQQHHHHQQLRAWTRAIETLVLIVSNILKYPADHKYYNVSLSNANFKDRVVRVPGAVNILIALGFREQSSDGSLQLPLIGGPSGNDGAELLVLNARRLELQAGLDLLLKAQAHLQAHAQAPTSTTTKADATSGKTLGATTAGAPSPMKGSQSKQQSGKFDSTATATTSADAGGAGAKTPNTPTRSQSSSANARAVVKQALRADAALDELAEVRSKWLQAESALAQNKDVIAELRTQVAQLQTTETHTQPIPAAAIGAFFNVKATGDLHKQQLQPQLSSSRNVGGGSGAGGTASPSPFTAHQHIPKTSTLHTYTTEPIVAGQSKIQVASNEHVVKGMRCVIGSGSNIEIHTVSGLGSVLLATPTKNSHPLHTPVRFFEHTKRGMERLHKFMHTEFVRQLLTEDIVSRAVAVAEDSLLAADLNAMYKTRPVLEHTCVVNIEAPIVINVDKLVTQQQRQQNQTSVSFDCALSVSQCSLTCLYDGQPYVSTFRVTPVELTLLFERLALRVRANHQRTAQALQDSIGFAPHIQTQHLLEVIQQGGTSVGHWTGVFQSFARAHAFTHIKELIDRFSSDDTSQADNTNPSTTEVITWDDFVNMILPTRHCAVNNTPKSGVISMQAAMVLCTSNSGTFTPQMIALLSKLFHICDVDGDDALSLAECCTLFQQLDNGHLLLEETQDIFSRSVQKVFGGRSAIGAEATHVTFEQFVVLRSQYAQSLRVCGGGLRLYGVLCVTAIAQTFYHTRSQGTDRINVEDTFISVTDVCAQLPQQVIDSVIPGQANEVGMMLQTASSVAQTNAHHSTHESGTLGVGDICALLCGENTLCGCPINTFSPVRDDNTNSIEIIQCLQDRNHTHLYLLRADGVCMLYSLQTHAYVCEQRVIWAEPLPSRAVEGSERFLKWRTECGIDEPSTAAATSAHTQESLEYRGQRAKEVKTSSQLLTRFMCSVLDIIHNKHGISANTQGATQAAQFSPARNILSIDAVTGLVVVNTFIASNSLCVLEPHSLRRLYRVRVPWKLDKDVGECVSAILGGSERFFVQDSGRSNNNMNVAHIPTQVYPVFARGVCVCQLAQGNDVRVMSMFTGETVVDLRGHTHTVLCTHIQHVSSAATHTECVLFTGSSDCTVRVWKLSDCVPAVNNVGSIEDNDALMQTLESKVINARAATLQQQQPRNIGRATFRSFVTTLLNALNLSAHWKMGVITSLYDGKTQIHSHTHSQALEQNDNYGIEVVFANATPCIYSNKIMLRSVQEMEVSRGTPPIWSRPHAHIRVGERVCVYEVDVDECVCVCARMAGVESNAFALTHAQVLAVFERMFVSAAAITSTINVPQTMNELQSVLYAMGIRGGDDSKHTISHIIRKLFRLQEKYQPICERVLIRHECAVCSVDTVPLARYLVSVDVSGCVCVWDPCESRTCLTLLDAAHSAPAFSGKYPFSLVSCVYLSDHVTQALRYAHPAAHAHDNSEVIIESCALKSVSVGSACAHHTQAFPMTSSAFMNALAVDKKYDTSNVTVRGFVYVFTDLSHQCVQSHCFLPALATLDSPEISLSENYNDLCALATHAQVMHSPTHTVTNTMNNMADIPCMFRHSSVLTRIYSQRDRLIRVVYVVSCTHTDIEVCAADLLKFGVLHRGYTITPSELVEVAVFERPPEWFDRTVLHTQVLSQASAQLLGAQSQTRMGIILHINRDSLEDNVRVALDFSNEVVFVSQSDIVRVIDAFPLGSHVTSHARPAQQQQPQHSNLLCVGNRVEFTHARSAMTMLPFQQTQNNMHTALQLDTQQNAIAEVVLFSVCARLANGTTYHTLLPLNIARATHVVPAHRQHLFSVEDTHSRLAQMQSHMLQTLLATSATHAYVKHTQRFMFENTLQSQRNLVLDALTVAHAQQSQNRTTAATPQAQDLSRQFVSLLSDVDNSHLRACVFMCVLLGLQRVSVSHPLFAYVQNVLGPQTCVTLCQHLSRMLSSSASSSPHTWSEWCMCVQDILNSWCMRTGLRVEELAHIQRLRGVSENNNNAADVETLLQRLLPQSHAHPPSSASLGNVTDKDVGALLAHTPSSSSTALTATGAHGNSRRHAPNIADEVDYLTLMLLKHHTTLLINKQQGLLRTLTSMTRNHLQQSFVSAANTVCVCVDEALAARSHSLLQARKQAPQRHRHGRTQSSVLPSSGTYMIHTQQRLYVGMDCVNADVIEAINVKNNADEFVTHKQYLTLSPNERFFAFEGGGDSSMQQFTQQDLLTALEVQAHSLTKTHAQQRASSVMNQYVLPSITDHTIVNRQSQPHSFPLYEWKPHYRTLASLLPSSSSATSSMLSPTRIHLFRLIAAALLHTMTQLQDAGVEVYGINPHTVIVDSNFDTNGGSFVDAFDGDNYDDNSLRVRVKLLSLPFLRRIDSVEVSASDIQRQLLQHYAACCKTHADLLACIPPSHSHTVSELFMWDRWSVGAILFHLAFGSPLVDEIPEEQAQQGQQGREEGQDQPSEAEVERRQSQTLIPRTVDEGIALILMRLATASTAVSADINTEPQPGTQQRPQGSVVTSIAPALVQLTRQGPSSGGMSQLLFSLTKTYTQTHTDRLQAFRDTFVSMGSTFGASTAAATLLWNKIMQRMCSHVPADVEDIHTLTDRLLSTVASELNVQAFSLTQAPTNTLTQSQTMSTTTRDPQQQLTATQAIQATQTQAEEACKEYLRTTFGIQLQKLEFLALVDCVCLLNAHTVAGTDGSKTGMATLMPFTEKAIICVKGLAVLWPDIYVFGLMQQVLYIIGSCLTDPKTQTQSRSHTQARSHQLQPQQASVPALEHTKLLNLSNESCTHQALRELHTMMAPFHSVDDFIKATFVLPLQSCVQTLLQGIASDTANDRVLSLVLPSVLELSSLLGFIEELMSVSVKQLSNEGPATKLHTQQTQAYVHYVFLSKSAASADWIMSHALDILRQVCELRIFQAIAFYVLRFLSTHIATSTAATDLHTVEQQFAVSDAYNSDTHAHSHSSSGLSMGSRVLMRTNKFFANCVRMLKEFSKGVQLDSHIQHSQQKQYLQQSELEGDENGRTDMDHQLSLDDNLENAPVHGRVVAQQLFENVLHAVLMLSVGEESPFVCLGVSGSTLAGTLPACVRSVGHDDANEEITLENRWSVQMFKIMDPLLTDLVGEDGKGGPRFTLAHTYTHESDLFFHQLASDGLTNPHAHVSQSRTWYRGSYYLMHMLHLLRMLSSSDLSGPAAMVARAQLSVCMFAYNLLPLESTVGNNAIALTHKKGAAGANDDLYTSFSSQLGVTAPTHASSTLLQCLQLFVDLGLIHKLAVWLNPNPQHASVTASGKKASSSTSTHAVITNVTDTHIKITTVILKTFTRVLTLIDTLRACEYVGDVCEHPLCVRLSAQCSNESVVTVCADILRSRVVDVDLTNAAALCVGAMSRRRNWMRCWSVLDVLPVVLFVAKSTHTQLAQARTSCIHAMQGVLLHDCATVDTLVAGRVVGFEHMQTLAHTYTQSLSSSREENAHVHSPLSALESLVEEANDLMFGSTINEQLTFTHTLTCWSKSLCEYVGLYKDDDNGNDEALFVSMSANELSPSQWALVYKLCASVSVWVPKLFLAMQLSVQTHTQTGTQTPQAREKLQTSTYLVCTQVCVLERLLCLALDANSGSGGDNDFDDTVVAAVVDTLWSTQTQAVVETTIDTQPHQQQQSGLIFCLEKMISIGVYVDCLLALRIQCHIMDLITAILTRAASSSNNRLLNALIGCGLFRSICRYYQCVFQCMCEVSRLNLHTQFVVEYAHIQSSLRRSWTAVLACVQNMALAKDIWDSGVLRCVCVDWLAHAKEIKSAYTTQQGGGVESQISLKVNKEFNSSLVVRAEAVHMLTSLIAYTHTLRNKTTNSVTQTSILSSTDAHSKAVEFLVSESVLLLMSSVRLTKEISLLRNVMQGSQTPTQTQTPKLSQSQLTELKKTAATLLASLASLQQESLLQRFQGDGVPLLLLTISSTADVYSLYVRDLWCKWGAGKFDADMQHVISSDSKTIETKTVTLAKGGTTLKGSSTRTRDLQASAASSSKKQQKDDEDFVEENEVFAEDEEFDDIDARNNAALAGRGDGFDATDPFLQSQSHSMRTKDVLHDKRNKSVSKMIDDLWNKHHAADEGELTADSIRRELAEGAGSTMTDTDTTHPLMTDVSVIMQRMGHILLGVKDVFDLRSNKKGLMNMDGCIGALLDLHIKDTQTVVLVEEFTMLGSDDVPPKPKQQQQGHGGTQQQFTPERVIDFPGFLQLYAGRCGLNARRKTVNLEPKHRLLQQSEPATVVNVDENIWTPNWNGKWMETSIETQQLVASSGANYFADSSSSTAAPSSVADLSHAWVMLEDVVDVMLLSGINATDSLLASALKAMRAFLPGLADKRLSFQEVLMLVKYVHELQALQQKGMLDDRPVPTESTMSRSQYASGIVGGGASTLDMARSTLTKPRSAASGSSTTTATQATALKAGWKLPTREHAETLSRSEIVSEFKKLDITGEGRLTFLTLKTALEIRDVQIDDTVIRGWLRTYDLGDKGYVDFSDFEMIYRDAAMNTASTRAATAGAGTGAGSRLFATTNEGRSLSASRRYSDHNFDDRTRQAQQQFASSLRSSNADFQQQLERTFDKYDVDGDGFISLQDLQQSLMMNSSRSRTYTQAELRAWIADKDRSGQGVVSFKDFKHHFQNS